MPVGTKNKNPRLCRGQIDAYGVRAVPLKTLFQNKLKGRIAPSCFFAQSFQAGILKVLFGVVEHVESEMANEFPPVFRLPERVFHATSFSSCCALTQSFKNWVGDL